jgi:hypothetical protein
VEHFIAEDLFEDRARRRIVVDDLAINRETAGGSFFRNVQKGEQTMVGFSFDGEVVEPVPAGQWTRIEQRSGTRRSQLKESGAALAEQIGVAKLVNGVLEVQSAKERIRRQLGGAEDIAAAVALDLCEGYELADPAIEISPHPPVDRTQYPVERRAVMSSHRVAASKRPASRT